MLDQASTQLLVLARRQIASGKLADARRTSDALLAANGDAAIAHLQRSRLESLDDNYRQARMHALAAYRLGPVGKEQHVHLLTRLKIFHLVDEMRTLVERMPEAMRTEPDVAAHVAFLFRAIGQPELALEHTERAVQLHPDDPALLTASGVTLINLGHFARARERLLDCVRIAPGHAAAWWQLSRLPAQPEAGAWIDRIRAALARSRDNKDSGLLAYALHRLLDQAGDHGEAAKALGTACFSMRRHVKYSAEDTLALFAALRGLDFGAFPAGVADAAFTPVFIVGMHRSGTTLLEQMLSGHDEVMAAGELYNFTHQLRYAADHHCVGELDLQVVRASPGFDYAEIGQGYLDSLEARRDGRRFVTDKLPSNFLNLGFILRALPNAKILHMVRDPMETCFSNLREPFSETTCRYSYDQLELAQYFREYEALMLHWQDRFPGRILHVHYSQLAGTPLDEMDRIVQFLGLDLRQAMLEPQRAGRTVSTASAVQVRSAPALPRSPKWFAYRDHLAPLVRALSPAGHKIGTPRTP